MMDLESLSRAIEMGKRDDSLECTRAALEASTPPDTILQAMVAAMDEVGRKFQCGEAFIPEMLLASRAMTVSMDLLEPVLVQSGLVPEFKVVVGTVEGDLHDIGKNLVAMMWKGANFEVIDLGTNVSPAAFIQAVKESGAQLVGLSALLTTTMPSMKKTVEAFREAGLTGVKIVLGGAPITREFADHVGADGYAADAASAVALARSLLAA